MKTMSDESESHRITGEILREIHNARLVDIGAHHNIGGYDDGVQSTYADLAVRLIAACAAAAEDGTLTWKQLALADLYAAYGQTRPERLREGLLQLAATVVANVADLDRREFEQLTLQQPLDELVGRAASIVHHPSTRRLPARDTRSIVAVFA